jgi:hypothetical protein
VQVSSHDGRDYLADVLGQGRILVSNSLDSVAVSYRACFAVVGQDEPSGFGALRSRSSRPAQGVW